jgi:hypothetical protein
VVSKIYGNMNQNVALNMETVAVSETSEQTLTTQGNSPQKDHYLKKSCENLNIDNYQ